MTYKHLSTTLNDNIFFFFLKIIHLAQINVHVFTWTVLLVGGELGKCNLK